MNVVLIPCWRRPEFLWHCLENIKLAEGAADLHYIFRPDHGYDPDLLKVIDAFPFKHEAVPTKRTPYQLGKQSYSLLTGYQYAAQRTNGLVFMVEEDVMVARDFFRWHIEVHRQRPDLFCSIAVANPNRSPTPIIDDTGSYYLSGNDYCSLGLCFRSEVIQQRIQPACESAYFINPVTYCERRFPGSPIGKAYAEQDGLIRRIQIALGEEHPIAWPWSPRAYHAGFYGKNRGAGPLLKLDARIKHLADIIYSDEAMRIFAKHPAWYADSRPINLTPEPWNEQRLLPLNEAAHPVGY